MIDKKNENTQKDITDLKSNSTASNLEISPVNLPSAKETPLDAENLKEEENFNEERLLKSPEPEQNPIISTKLQEFMEICTSNIIPEKYKDLLSAKIDKLHEKFKNADTKYTESKTFKNLVNSSIDKLKKKPVNVLVYYKTIYDELKANKYCDIELTDKQDIHLAKLSKTMKILDKKIRMLEETEVDFEDDNDSTYIQLDRYRQRFVQVR